MATLEEYLAALNLPVATTNTEQKPEQQNVKQVSLKGEPVRMFDWPQSVNALSDKAVDCRDYNALNVQVFVTGTTPSATISVEGSDAGGGNYVLVPDPGASVDGIGASLSFAVGIGTSFAKVRVSNIAGTFAAGQGYIIICTPYVSSGPLAVEASGRIVHVDANFTRPNDTTQYAAGEAVTDSTSAPTVITFTNCARKNGGSGVIMDAWLFDSANQTTKGSFELWLFDTSPTPDNDNAVFTPTDAENRTLIDIIPFDTNYVGDATSAAGGNCVFPKKALNTAFKCTAASRNLFGLLVARNAYPPVAQERFDIRFKINQD